MGVQGLWSLLSPAGRRIKIETLEGKVLAIDVSIWLLKMIHGYLQLGTEEYRNVHLTGIFRRIVKLLFYGIKPVFVFDGKFPELKKETVRKRQEFREKRRVDLKRVAQKYLSKVLEDRLKETVGRLAVPRKGPLLLTDSQSEFPKEEEKNDESKIFGESEEEEQEQLYDYEFDYFVDQNKELLEEDGIDLEEFYLQDMETQYEIVKKVKNKIRDNKIKKYLEIENLDDLSKMHIQDSVKQMQKKKKLEKLKEEASAKRMEKEQEMAIADTKYKDVMQSQYMKTFFLDPKKEILQGSLASDPRKKFIYLTQKNEKYDAQTMRVEKKRGGKHEKLKKLTAQLRDIAQHSEAAPQYFSFDELLCDNPLEAFKHSNSKDQFQGLGASEQKNNISPEKNKGEEEAETKVDVDDVFGFDDWEQNPEENNEVKEETQEVKKTEPIEKGGHDSDLEDLFEYKIEDEDDQQTQAPTVETNRAKEKIQEPQKKVEKMELQNTVLQSNILFKGLETKEQDNAQVLTQKSGDNEREEEEIEMPRKLKVSFKAKNSKRDTTSDFFTQALSQNSQFDEPIQVFSQLDDIYSQPVNSQRNVERKDESIKLFKMSSPETTKEGKFNVYEYKIPDSQTEMEEEKSLQVVGASSDSKMNEESNKEKKVLKPALKQNTNKPKPGKTEGSWFHRLVNESQSQAIKMLPTSSQAIPSSQVMKEEPIKKGLDPNEDDIMEIQMYKDTQDDSQGDRQRSQQNSQHIKFEKRFIPPESTQEINKAMNNIFGDDMDFNDLDEEKLVNEMKGLDDPDNVDKWALMQEFQKFQNLSEFEAGSIQEKFNEIKELLILFGIPWVESPAEAEAQCSYLEESGLVDGIITDDSDVFLFGGRSVYRNIFDKGDYAHAYKMGYIENDMALNREQLILLALFLGSDYTMGIRGVGIVNAMEIVTAFDSFEALRRFKEWAEVPDVLLENASEYYKNIPQKELDYKLYHRNFKKHWELPDEFPDKRVVEGYTHPSVDKSEEKFQWGKPDMESLQRYCETKFKWEEGRILNQLEPLKLAMKDKGNQSKITDFFREEKIAEVNSKRINEAIKNLKQKGTEEREMPATITKSIENILEKQNPSNIKKRKTGDYAGELIKQFAFDKKKPKKM